MILNNPKLVYNGQIYALEFVLGELELQRPVIVELDGNEPGPVFLAPISFVRRFVDDDLSRLKNLNGGVGLVLSGRNDLDEPCVFFLDDARVVSYGQQLGFQQLTIIYSALVRLD